MIHEHLCGYIYIYSHEMASKVLLHHSSNSSKSYAGFIRGPIRHLFMSFDYVFTTKFWLDHASYSWSLHFQRILRLWYDRGNTDLWTSRMHACMINHGEAGRRCLSWQRLVKDRGGRHCWPQGGRKGEWGRTVCLPVWFDKGANIDLPLCTPADTT